MTQDDSVELYIDPSGGRDNFCRIIFSAWLEDQVGDYEDSHDDILTAVHRLRTSQMRLFQHSFADLTSQCKIELGFPSQNSPCAGPGFLPEKIYLIEMEIVIDIMVD